jgi:hypothetical protein
MRTRSQGYLHNRLTARVGSLRTAASAALALTLVSAGLIAGLAGPASAASSVLAPGQELTASQELTAGPYVLIMQGDGNLVEYNGGTALWATDTAGQPGNWAIMQTDGNLVVYGAQNQVRWSSGTWGYSGTDLVLQTDANVVEYLNGRAIWATSWLQNAGAAQTYAQEMFTHYGWSSGQYTYLNNLWTRESNWRWNVCSGGATFPNCNYTGSAYGIPQADPG